MMAGGKLRDTPLPPLLPAAVALPQVEPFSSPSRLPRLSRVATTAVVTAVLCVCGLAAGGWAASTAHGLRGPTAAAPAAGGAAATHGGGATPSAAMAAAEGGRGGDGAGHGDESDGGGGAPRLDGRGPTTGVAGRLLPPPPLRQVYRLPQDTTPPPNEPFDVPRSIAVSAVPLDARQLRALTPPPHPPAVAGGATAPPPPPAGVALAVTVQGAVRSRVPVQLNVTHLVVGTTAVPVVRHYRSLVVGVLSAAAAAAVPAAARVSVAVPVERPWRVGPTTNAQRRALRRGVRREQLQTQGGDGLAAAPVDALVVNSHLTWADVHLDGEGGLADTPAPPFAGAAASRLNPQTPSAAAPAASGVPATPPGAPSKGVYAICAMTQAIYSAREVLHWLDYHRRLGVDHLYLYSNEPNSTALAAELAPRADVEVIHWPWRRSQFAAGGHFLTAARPRCDWVVLVDLDEWLLVREDLLPPAATPPPPGPHPPATPLLPLPRALAHLRATTGAEQLVVRSLRMGSSGRLAAVPHALPEIFVHRIAEYSPPKPVFRAAAAVPATMVHYVRLAPGARGVDVPGTILRPADAARGGVSSRADATATAAAAKAHAPPPAAAVMVVVHYSRRSWEEQWVKGLHPRSSTEVGDNPRPVAGSPEASDPASPALALARERHLSMDGQLPYGEMAAAWAAVMRRPLPLQRVVAPRAEGEWGGVASWLRAPSVATRR